MRRIVIAGGSAAGLAAASALRSRGYDGELFVVDEEESAPYRRPVVSKTALTGAIETSAARLAGAAELEAEWLGGWRLTGLDLQRSTVVATAGTELQELPFDGLVIATGCDARRLTSVDGTEAVHHLRSIADAARLRASLASAQRLLVIGGGFIGLEVASSARALGVEVVIVEAAPQPLSRAVGTEAAEVVAGLHAEHGVEVVCNAAVERWETSAAGDEARVVLADGRALSGDVLVAAVGSAPRVEWLAETGWDLRDGVRCDETCAVEGTPRIVAAGDVASWPNALYGRRMRVEHWTNATEQGRHAAGRLLGDRESFSSAPYFWSDQLRSRIQRVGLCGPEQVVLERGERSVVVAFGEAGRLVGVAGVNAGAAVMRMRARVAARAAIDELVVGPEQAPAMANATSEVNTA